MPLLGALAVIVLAAVVYRIARQRSAPARSDVIALEAPRASWPERVGEREQPNASERIAIVQRLAVVGSDWCIEALESALADEQDPAVRDAVWNALLALRAEDAG